MREFIKIMGLKKEDKWYSSNHFLNGEPVYSGTLEDWSLEASYVDWRTGENRREEGIICIFMSKFKDGLKLCFTYMFSEEIATDKELINIMLSHEIHQFYK